MMAVARCHLPDRPVPASHTDVPCSTVGLRAIQAIFTRKALLCPCGPADSAPTEPESPLSYGVGGLATPGDPPAPPFLIH